MQEPLELKSVIYDNTSGAREIALKSLQLLQRLATQSTAATAPELLDELSDAAVKILRSKPEMGIVFSCLNRFVLEAEEFETAPDVGELRIQAVARLQEQVRRMEADLQRAAQHAGELVQNGDVVLTYSRSSTVLAALKHAKASGKTFDVVTAESRPNLEGRTIARELSEDQIPVRFVVDALLGTAVEGADRVLVGADAITPRSFVNKVGTKLLVMAARARDLPVHVVADSGKAWVKRTDPTVSLLGGKLRDPKEVWDQPPYGVEIVNLYFEETPLDWCAGIASEAGVQTASEFWSGVRATGYARRIRRAFGDELQ
jgi:translation initiation factor 2B subunit (eIF-2B alpha/beta/delta family)